MKTLVGRYLLKGFATIAICAFYLLISSTLTGCLDEGSGSEDDTQVIAVPEEPVDNDGDGVPDEPLPPLTPPQRTLCDPFSAGTSARDRGLIGNLLYLEDDQPRYRSVVDYIENATPVESTLYFDQVYIPTRKFDLGFYTQDGNLVLNHNDEPIYEYFAVRLESQLTLGEAEEEGWYQMAVLSDDGAVVRERNADGSISVLVDNDGTHPTRMGCASEAIYMDKNSKRNIILEYYQGPRYHISMIVMWRKLGEAEDPLNPDRDVQCGRQGNSMYFDYTVVPSEPKPTYYEMLTRGWRPLSNENYYFPEQADNPCAAEDPLVLTNFSINSTSRTEVSVSWNSSIAASSQVEVKNITTGEIVASAVVPGPTTSHAMTFSGLSPSTLYSVKGISASDDGQTASTSEFAFRTAR